MSHYSYHCKQCGFTVNGTRGQAQHAKRVHRTSDPISKSRRCTGMVEWEKGRFCRSDLAEHMKSEQA